MKKNTSSAPFSEIEVKGFRPVLYTDDGTNIEYGNAPVELGDSKLFLTETACKAWLEKNNYDPDDYVIFNHADEISELEFIDEFGDELPKDFINWRFSGRPFWFVCVRTPGTTNDFVFSEFKEAKKYVLKDFRKGCVSLEFYKVTVTPDERAKVEDFDHLAELVGLDCIGKQTPMLLAMCERLDEIDDDTATYGEKLQLMSFERIVEALKNLKEDSYLLTKEEFHDK
jgi:hypothetical protein